MLLQSALLLWGYPLETAKYYLAQNDREKAREVLKLFYFQEFV